MSLILSDNIYEYVKNFATISDEEVEEIKQYLCSLEHIGMTYVKGETKVHIGSKYYNIHLINEEEVYEIILVNNTISTINKMKTKVDLDEIRSKSELQDFPMNIGNKYEIRTTETSAIIFNTESGEETSLKLVALGSLPNESHEPLYEYQNYMIRDKFMPVYIDELDSNLHTFVIVRFAWGLNISAAIFDEATCTLYHWDSYNYDYPEGISVRKNNDKIEIYLNSNDRSEREKIYCNKVLECDERYELSLDWSYESHWGQFDKLDFVKLIGYMKFCKEQSNYTSYTERIKLIENESIKLFEQKQYLETLNLYNTIFEINKRTNMKNDLRIVMNHCEFLLMAKPEMKEEIIDKLLMILQTPSRSIFQFGDKQCIEELKENENYAEIITDIRIAKYLV